ncbi:hypothetical protein WJX72_012053 [[Myrmecia] bisecta]|uniref:Glycosyltransferase family 92 protein n=1 Tax=[Myrmecia] bisecta TaxID=41462 RepID=A0AAW1PF98_9CHLO
MATISAMRCLLCLAVLGVCTARLAAGQYLAMCAIIKNEQRNIREWVEYHHSIGAEKFYIYDHNSTHPAVIEVQDYIDQGLVEYTYFVNFTSLRSPYPQQYVYDKCLADHRTRHHFMAFIDADEFIILKAGQPSLPHLLAAYEDVGGLAINWVLFGSSGHKQRPQGGVLESYTKCQPLSHPKHTHVKLIGNTHFTRYIGATPHDFIFEPPKFAVTENFERVDGPFSATISMNKVAIYHYVIKSEQDFGVKMGRGSAHGVTVKDWDYFHYVDQQATDDCLDAVHLYAPQGNQTTVASV